MDEDHRFIDEPREGVALFVDGPNVLRDEFDVDLDDVREAAAAVGRLAVSRLYLDEHAPAGLIQAAEARGYEVVTTSGDVDVKLAVDMAEMVLVGNVEAVAIASRDTDFKPALELAGRRGVRTLAIAPGSYGRSDALRNAADDSVTLEDDDADGVESPAGEGQTSDGVTTEGGTDGESRGESGTSGDDEGRGRETDTVVEMKCDPAEFERSTEE